MGIFGPPDDEHTYEIDVREVHADEARQRALQSQKKLGSVRKQMDALCTAIDQTIEHYNAPFMKHMNESFDLNLLRNSDLWKNVKIRNMVHTARRCLQLDAEHVTNPELARTYKLFNKLKEQSESIHMLKQLLDDVANGEANKDLSKGLAKTAKEQITKLKNTLEQIQKIGAKPMLIDLEKAHHNIANTLEEADRFEETLPASLHNMLVIVSKAKKQTLAAQQIERRTSRGEFQID